MGDANSRVLCSCLCRSSVDHDISATMAKCYLGCGVDNLDRVVPIRRAGMEVCGDSDKSCPSSVGAGGVGARMCRFSPWRRR